jgi:hypothetical protein
MKNVLKRMMKAASLALCLLTVLAGTACKSTAKTQEAASKAISAQAEREALPAKTIDWSNRGIGEVADPPWILPARRGNWTKFKEEWNIGSEKVLKLGIARNANLNAAQTIADVQYAAQQARQLRERVLSKMGISVRDDGEFDTVQDAATKTKVSIAGQERLTDFWQLREIDEGDGKKSRVYVYYVVYAYDSAVWKKLTAKYLNDIIKQVPETKTQRTIAGMFDELSADEQEKSEEEFQAEVKAMEQALLNGPMSAAEIRDAYRSGDPARITAASTTDADADYVAALRLIAEGSDSAD